MTIPLDAVPAGAVPASAEIARATHPRRRYLFNPWVDFLALGGGSVVVLGALAVFYPKDDAARAGLAATMLILAHFVNHPHFAHSYQLFYKGFIAKAFSSESALRHRYRFTGIMVPAVLASFFACTLAQGNAALLGLAANLMFFMVGWHYVKQGFGILMLDATHKGTRFTARERRHLLWNAHVAWPTYWLMTNDALAGKNYWGLTYYLFDAPDALLGAMFALTALTAAVVARDLFIRWRAGGALPLNGLVAYVVSVYVWLLIARHDPILFLVVPMFHSLQYLCVVWRYQLNVEAHKRPEPPAGGGRTGASAWYRSATAGFLRFLLAGGLLGAMGFWVAPMFFDAHAGYDRAVFGTTLSIFIAWIFINVHHYFIDSVIWRRENADTRRYLFAA